MPDFSNLLEITELSGTQETRSVTVNEAIAKLEAGAGLFPALDVNLNTPPGSPAEGDVYVLGAAPTGAWSGQGSDIALFYNASWRFMPARDGLMAYAVNDDSYYRFATAYGWELTTIAAGGGGVGTTQTDFWSGFVIGEVPDGDIWLAINLPFAVTITSVSTKSSAGTGTATVTVDGTPIGTANDVSTAQDVEAHSDVAAIGTDVKLLIANDSPAIENMAFLVAYTYELA